MQGYCMATKYRLLRLLAFPTSRARADVIQYLIFRKTKYSQSRERCRYINFLLYLLKTFSFKANLN